MAHTGQTLEHLEVINFLHNLKSEKITVRSYDLSRTLHIDRNHSQRTEQEGVSQVADLVYTVYLTLA